MTSFDSIEGLSEFGSLAGDAALLLQLVQQLNRGSERRNMRKTLQ
jgi:hypothetical protein